MDISGYIVLGVVGLALVLCMIIGIMEDKKNKSN